jgi:hypothetical protein
LVGSFAAKPLLPYLLGRIFPIYIFVMVFNFSPMLYLR